MDSTVALIIIFNHNYQANLEKLDVIYRGRFSKIFYVIPFYEGNRTDVIPVYESSHYFQGFMSTAINKLQNENIAHFFFLADDLFINPQINENNYQNFFKIDTNSSFISNYFSLADLKETKPSRPFAPFWSAIPMALKFNPKKPDFEVFRYLPTYEQAEQKLKDHKFLFKKRIPRRMFFSKHFYKRKGFLNNLKEIFVLLSLNISNTHYLFEKNDLKYPFVGGYSDLIILDKASSFNFSKYAAAFAAKNLFVEIAAPTALLLSCKTVITENDVHLKTKTVWYHDRLINDLELGNSITDIMINFPNDILYIHPLKLSKVTF